MHKFFAIDRRKSALLLSLAWVCTMLAWGAVGAQAKSPPVFIGRIDHVSMDNIKVYSPTEHQTLSFVLLPRFKSLFSSNGKTTYQMAQLRPGMMVKVFYDQKLMGARHADKIFILNANGHALKAMKS